MSSSPARPTTRPRRSTTLSDTRRESIWNLIVKFPLPTSSDTPPRKSRSSRQRLRPTPQPIVIPHTIPDSFLDLSSSISLDSGFISRSGSETSAEEGDKLQTGNGRITTSPETYLKNPEEDWPAVARKPSVPLRRTSSVTDIYQMRSHWSDDSSDEHDGHDDDEGDDDFYDTNKNPEEAEDNASSPLSPTFLAAWRSRFVRTSPISHRQSRSFPPPSITSDLVSPRTKTRSRVSLSLKRTSRDTERKLGEEVSMQQILEDGPVVEVVRRSRSISWSQRTRITRRQAAEDVAWQFGQWPGFASESS